MKNPTQLMFALLLLVSCSQLLEFDQARDQKYKVLPIVQPQPPLECLNSKTKVWVVTEVEQIQSAVQLYIKEYGPNIDEIFAATALLHLWARPDLASPTSTIEVFRIENSTIQHFYNSKTSTSLNDPLRPVFLSFVNTLLQQNGTTTNIVKIAQRLDHLPLKSWRANVAVAENLSRQNLSQYPLFKQAYYKGDNLIQAGEGLPQFKLHPIIREEQGQLKNDFQTDADVLKKQCNYSHQSDAQSKSPLDYVMFAIGDARQTYIGVITQDLKGLKPWKKTSLFATTASVTPSVEYCVDDKLGLALVYHGRAPRQLLAHLNPVLHQGLSLTEHARNVLLRPRWIEVDHPRRIVGEFSRAQRLAGNNDKIVIPPPLHYLPQFNDSSIGKILLAPLRQHVHANESPVHFDSRGQLFGHCQF